MGVIEFATAGGRISNWGSGTAAVETGTAALIVVVQVASHVGNRN